LFPDLSSCSECGVELAETDEAIIDVELRAHCDNCRQYGSSAISLSVLRILHATHRLSPAKFVELYGLSEADDSELGEITHRLITRAIDRRPRTLVASTR